MSVQLPEPVAPDSGAAQAGYRTIADISRRRISLSGDSLRNVQANLLETDINMLDTGFRAFKLVDTNFTKWQAASDIDASALVQQLLSLHDSADDEATPDDLFTEILLKQGFSLTERIASREVAGLELSAVLQADGDLAVLAYLNELVQPTHEQFRRMVAEIPGGKIIVLEDAFHGDDELKTNLAQLCKTNGIELWTA